MESLDITVLLMKFTARESCKETPAPSQPATLFAMMLLVTLTEYQRDGAFGKNPTSAPLIPWRRRPPPAPLSAAFPRIRLASITIPGPVPSLTPPALSGQSWSGSPGHVGSVSGALMITSPPPSVGTVGLVLSLKRKALCWTLAFQT